MIYINIYMIMQVTPGDVSSLNCFYYKKKKLQQRHLDSSLYTHTYCYMGQELLYMLPIVIVVNTLS